uniref:Replicase n=1 Tax=Botryosphaeria dothidea botrexvirus 1 TaxID=2785370 RepID=A0A7T4X3K7_9VIRU|nr:replicase [Botryosphaeria dothidea botrexvirus 1]
MPTLQVLQDSLSDPTTRAVAAELTLKELKAGLRLAKRYANYALSDAEANQLESFGILTYPHATTRHSHAAEKILENYMLHLVARHWHTRPGPKTLLQFKRAKLQYLDRGPQHDDQILNWVHEPKDLLRYDVDSLGTLLGTPILHEDALLHDTLHFLSPALVQAIFAKNPSLQRLMCTTVLPVEAQHGLPSLFPALYGLEYLQGGFLYNPGHHAGSGYFHARETLDWLSAGKIKGTFGPSLSVQKLETHGAHHLFLFTRGNYPVAPIHAYHQTELATLHPVFYPEDCNVMRPYPKTLLSRLMLYCWSVKAVSLRDIFAKIRQTVKTDQLYQFDMADTLRLANYLLVATALQNHHDCDTVLQSTVFSRVAKRVRARMRTWLRPLVGRTQYEELQTMTKWTDFHLHSRTRTLWACTRPRWAHQHEEPDLTPGDDSPAEGPPVTVKPMSREGLERMADKLGLTPVELAQATARDEALDEAPTEDTQVEPEEPAEAPAPMRIPSHLTPEEEEVLRAHGFTNLAPQFSQWGRITPVRFNPGVPAETTPPPAQFRRLADRLHKLGRRSYAYEVNRERAGAFSSDAKNARTGQLLPKQPPAWLASLAARCEQGERDPLALTVIHGCGGSGKSYALQDVLRHDRETAAAATVVVPTVALREDWASKLPLLRSHQIKTYEKAIIQEATEVVIMDDHGKLPPGYVDCYLVAHPNVEWVILTGDHRQSGHHVANLEARTAHLEQEAKYFRAWADYYLNATHRQGRRLANPLDVHAEKEGGAVVTADLLPREGVTLVPSNRRQQELHELERQAYTYAGCQGLTVPHVTISLERDTPLCSDEVMYTALSRASESVTFVNTYSQQQGFLEKLETTPYLKTFLSGVREDEKVGADEPPAEHEAPAPPPPKTHLPVEDVGGLTDDLIENCDDKDTREVFTENHGKTNLAQTDNLHTQLFAHQQAKDDALMEITMDKRIKLSTENLNKRQVSDTVDLGNLLFEAYSDRMNVPKEPQAFDEELWHQCRQKAERTYLSKTAAQIFNGRERQDPDFEDNFIALFNKSQWVKKVEKLGKAFKAGQTISSFKQEVVLITTTMALYLRAKRESHQPDDVFIMCERTPGQFNKFVHDHWDHDRLAFTNDYVSYDQSQDGPFLNFELRKARHFGIPSEHTDFYRDLKCNARVFSGILAIMRLSGEGPTFDANTECNIAYDSLRYRVPRGTAACYAGDDLARDRVCEERPIWANLANAFTLESKPEVTDRPGFCGWRITPRGIVKDPKQLWHSLQLGIDLGKLAEMVPSYSMDFAYAYELGDGVFDIFSEEDLAYHQATVRLMTRMGVHPRVAGDHLPAYHVRSDKLLAVRGTMPRPARSPRPAPTVSAITVAANPSPHPKLAALAASLNPLGARALRAFNRRDPSDARNALERLL